ncbi:MAG: F0F1 ATP synthase subunit B [Clostridiales bacterium]|nr:F0F1 ATP synthase subunit B [Clostridiales bacterium]
MLDSLNVFKFIQVALSFIILYIVLSKILFKPVTKFMEDRTRSIKDSLDSAERQKLEAAELKKSYEAQLKAAREESDRIIEDARLKAEKQHGIILAEAKQEADAVLEKAREEIAHERQQMLKDLRGQISGIALVAASKVIEANMNTDANKAMVDRFIDEAGVA